MDSVLRSCDAKQDKAAVGKLRIHMYVMVASLLL
jgi:hypothetical protein